MRNTQGWESVMLAVLTSTWFLLFLETRCSPSVLRIDWRNYGTNFKWKGFYITNVFPYAFFVFGVAYVVLKKNL